MGLDCSKLLKFLQIENILKNHAKIDIELKKSYLIIKLSDILKN